MKYIKLFKENTLDCHVKDYFNNILDNQDVKFEEIEVNKFTNIYLIYQDTNGFNSEDLEESINYLKDDGYKIENGRIYFFFRDIERIPYRSFVDKIPSKYELHSLYKASLDENGPTEYPEDCEDGKLKIEFSIYKE